MASEDLLLQPGIDRHQLIFEPSYYQNTQNVSDHDVSDQIGDHGIGIVVDAALHTEGGESDHSWGQGVKSEGNSIEVDPEL